MAKRKKPLYQASGGEIVGLLVRDSSGEETLYRVPAQGQPLSEPKDVLAALFRHFPAEMADTREHFMALYLDNRRRVMEAKVISTGNGYSSLVCPQQVFRPALLCAAGSVVVAHNHPSGDPEPSPEDIASTRRLDKAAGLLGFRLLDHLVVTASGANVSLRERQRSGRLPVEVFA